MFTDSVCRNSGRHSRASLSGASAGKTWPFGCSIWFLCWISQRLISARFSRSGASMEPLLPWASHRMLAGFWKVSLATETGRSGIALEVACWHFCHSVDWNCQGLSQIQGEGTKIPSLNRRNDKESGAMFYSHHKCPLNLSCAPKPQLLWKKEF